MRRAWTWLCLAFIGSSVACGPPRVQLDEPARNYEPDDYRSILRKWTRDSQLNSLTAMDNVLTVTSTYHSADFRRAYVARYAEDYRLTTDDEKALTDRSRAEAGELEHFYVALYAQNAKYNDLKLEDPAWVVRLVDDTETETPPLEIQPIKRPGAIERTYFPYTSPWRVAYRISFPRRTTSGRPAIRKGAAWFGLRFAGPQGQTTLVWQTG